MFNYENIIISFSGMCIFSYIKDLFYLPDDFFLVSFARSACKLNCDICSYHFFVFTDRDSYK